MVDFKNCETKELQARVNELSKILDQLMYDDPDKKWSTTYDEYEAITAELDERWRNENYESFRAYELRMNEPDFDWQYYSDWHKDMFGYRPRVKSVPQSEEERLAWRRMAAV